MSSMEDHLPSTSGEDTLWMEIREDAIQMGSEESELFLDMDSSELLLPGILHDSILRWNSLEEALAALLASKLSWDFAQTKRWFSILLTSFIKGVSTSGAPILHLIKEDLLAIKEQDPACPSLGHAFLYFKGFHGIQVYRASNWLWQHGQRSLASLFQSRASEVFGMDIHPAAQLESRIMIDHATGVVIGESARVGKGCTLLHGVTLGGNGKQRGDRHPKLGSNVLAGAGASILGNVMIGDGAKIGASAVVLNDIPAFATAVGCPAKVIGRVNEANPASVLDHSCELVNPFNKRIKDALPFKPFNHSAADLKPCNFDDQLQNVGGMEVPQKDAMALFFERVRSSSSRLWKQSSEVESRNIQYKILCST